jgi:hypothetical protein
MASRTLVPSPTPAVTGGMTLLSQTAFSGTSVTLSSIPQTYNSLKLVIVGISGTAALGNIQLGINGSTNLNAYVGSSWGNGGVQAMAGAGDAYLNLTRVDIQNTTSTFVVDLGFYTGTTTWKPVFAYGAYDYASSGATSFTTEAVYNSSPYDYIYFTLNDYNMSQSQNIFGMFSKSILGDNILAVIPVTSNSFNICFDNGINLIEKKREYYGPVNIQRLKIQLLNQYGEVLNLNNMDFSFSLELEIGYDW